MSAEGDKVDLTKERGPVRFPPPFVYLGGLILGAVAELFWSTPNLPLPLAIAAGVVGVGAFVLLSYNSIKNFDKHGTPAPPWEPTTALVTDGLYRSTRNPIYLGFSGFYIGLALAFGILWSLALLPVAILIIDRAVIAERRALPRAALRRRLPDLQNQGPSLDLRGTPPQRADPDPPSKAFQQFEVPGVRERVWKNLDVYSQERGALLSEEEARCDQNKRQMPRT